MRLSRLRWGVQGRHSASKPSGRAQMASSALVAGAGVSGSSALVGSLYSWHWHKDIEAERPRYTTFAQSSEREHDELTSMHNCIRPEVRFRALLTQHEIQKLDVVRA